MKVILIPLFFFFASAFHIARAETEISTPSPSASDAPAAQISDSLVRSDYENALKLLDPKNAALLAEGDRGSVGTRGGGNIKVSQLNALIGWMKSGQLNGVVAEYAKKIDSAKSLSPDATAIWNLMMNHGLLDNIKNSRYIPSELGCPTGSDPNSTASAVIGGRVLNQTDICFDVVQLVNERTSLASLVTIALHEHLHLYGFHEESVPTFTEMVGSQINSMEAANSVPISDRISSSPDEHRLATSIKKGSTFKLLENLDRVDGPFFQHGHIYSGFGDLSDGPDCFLQGYLKAGKTYKVVNASGGWSDVRSLKTTSPDVSFFLDPTGEIICERRPDTGAQLTVAEIHEILDGVFELKLKF